MAFFICSIYSDDHNDNNRAVRQQGLRDSLKITCDCLACVRDYPMLSVWSMKQEHGFVKPVKHIKFCDEYKLQNR